MAKEAITPEAFQKLEKGDWIQTLEDRQGTIQWFGRFTGKRWVKSTRRNADGVWVDLGRGEDGYISRTHISHYLPAPIATRATVGIPVKYKPEPSVKAKPVEGKAETRYKELIKPRLEAHDREIKAVNDDFMAGKMSSKQMNEKHKAIHKKIDAVAATMRKRVWGEYPEALPSRAELEKIQRMRTSRSQASDLARQHSIVIGTDNPKVATWLKDQGTADIQGIDTPPISRRVKIGRRIPRISPKVGRLK